MIRCYLGLGSNLCAPKRQLRQALTALQRLPFTQVIEVAEFYRNKAWGRKAQPDFYNTVVVLHTRLTPEYLLKLCQAIELRQGRVRKKIPNGARTLDIDILLFANRQIRSPQLTIPHPKFKERDFVLVPLYSLKTLTDPLRDLVISDC